MPVAGNRPFENSTTEGKKGVTSGLGKTLKAASREKRQGKRGATFRGKVLEGL